MRSWLVIALIAAACGRVAPSDALVTPTPNRTVMTTAAPSDYFAAVSTPAYRGRPATVNVVTRPNARCTIGVSYLFETEWAALDPKRADAAGNVSWTWIVSSTAAAGSWPVVVTYEGYEIRTHMPVDTGGS